MILGGYALALCFLRLGHGLAALALGAVASLLGVALALLLFGSRVELGETRLRLSMGFLPYSFPWSDVRGFVIDDRSPSEIYVAALDLRLQRVALFEIPMIEPRSPLALAVLLDREANKRRAGRSASECGGPALDPSLRGVPSTDGS